MCFFFVFFFYEEIRNIIPESNTLNMVFLWGEGWGYKHMSTDYDVAWNSLVLHCDFKIPHVT